MVSCSLFTFSIATMKQGRHAEIAFLTSFKWLIIELVKVSDADEDDSHIFVWLGVFST